MNKAIILPDGKHLHPSPGKYRIIPSPDLNKMVERRFLLEYDFPFLLVQEMGTRHGSETEKGEAIKQARLWEQQHTEGHVSYDRGGYLFNKRSSTRDRRCDHYQLIPDISYVDERTWSRLSDDEKDLAYVPCVPAVVIELMSATDKIEDLQEKVTKFINAGTREGVIVDTRLEQIWVYNWNENPFYYHELVPIDFDSWPEFTLDCIAIRNARTRTGLS